MGHWAPSYVCVSCHVFVCVCSVHSVLEKYAQMASIFQAFCLDERNRGWHGMEVTWVTRQRLMCYIYNVDSTYTFFFLCTSNANSSHNTDIHLKYSILFYTFFFLLFFLKLSLYVCTSYFERFFSSPSPSEWEYSICSNGERKRELENVSTAVNDARLRYTLMLTNACHGMQQLTHIEIVCSSCTCIVHCPKLFC